MKPRLKSSPAARELIKAHEPLATSARQGGDGSWVVGYGHHAAAKAGASVSAEEAELLLVYDVLQAEQAIDEAIGGDLGASQRDALVSFALGIGLASFRRSAVVRFIRKDRWHEAADAIAAWNGGGDARRSAERELFLTDLPEDADRTPVELVIEFDHPSDDEPIIPLVDDADLEIEPETTTEEAAAPIAEPIVEPVEAGIVPAEAPLVASVGVSPGRSELAERVILRMRTQLSGPVRESGYSDMPLSDDIATEVVDEPLVEPEAEGNLGFAYTQSVSIDDDEAPADVEDADVPPIVGVGAASQDGAAGEVSGSGETGDETASDEDQDDLLNPEDIDAEFASDEAQTGALNGWSTGDSAPAPGKNGGHLGEIILLVIGLVLMVGGGWAVVSELGSGEEQPNLFIGLASLVAGFIFATGAAIWLFGSKKK